jgi:hypothetical protein
MSDPVMDLSTLILKVRNGLSDIPLSYIDASAIYNDLQRAESFVILIKRDEIVDTDDGYIKSVEMLGSYYSYMTWTTLAEKQLGELPYSTAQKCEQLRSISKSFLVLISKYKLKDDLSIDTAGYSGYPIIGGLTVSSCQ